MLRAMKRFAPNGHTTVLAHGIGAAVLEGNPHVDEVFKVSCRGMAAKFSHLTTLRRTRYDIGILAQHSLANAVFLWSVGCKQRVGIDSKGCGLFLTHRVPTMGLVHEVTRYLKLAEALGANGDSSGLEFFTTEADRQSVAQFLVEQGYDLQQRDGRPLIALFPGSSQQWRFKRWPADRFAQTGSRLVMQHNACLLLLGGPDDRDAIDEISQTLTVPFCVVDSSHSIGRLAALLAACDLLITNDSGPMHLATAVGTPVVDLAGPSDPRRTGPYGAGHVVIQRVAPGSPKQWIDAPDPQLPMKAIGVEDVVAAAVEQIAKTRLV